MTKAAGTAAKSTPTGAMPTGRTRLPASSTTVNGGGRKAEIIAVSTALFREHGYHATSLDDIAGRIGFTKPAIYYYFKSKEDILFAIVDNVVGGALERMREIAARDASPVERLHALLVENTRVVLENIEANTVFYNERGLLSPERERDIRDREREYTQVLRDLYIEGVASNDFLDIDPRVATATLLGASIWAYRWFDATGRLSVDEVAEDVARLLMSGYLA
ncbi:MAG: TetR/AcrR family transcriptional regulator [Chloroflexota bacterium]